MRTDKQYPDRFVRLPRRVERLARIRRPMKTGTLNLSEPSNSTLQDLFGGHGYQGNLSFMESNTVNRNTVSQLDGIALAGLDSLDTYSYTAAILRKRKRQGNEAFEDIQGSKASFPRSSKRRKVLENQLTALQQQSTIMNPQHSFHAATGTFSVSFFGLEAPQRRPVRAYRKGLNRGKRWAWAGQMSAFMNPKQIYHSATGTFSTIFSTSNSSNQDSVNKPDKRVHKKDKLAFEVEIDDVLRRELIGEDLSGHNQPHWPFINHSMQHDHQCLVSDNYDQTMHKQFSTLGVPKTTDKMANEELEPTSAISTRVAPKRKQVRLEHKVRPLTARARIDDEEWYNEDETLELQNNGRRSKARKIRGPHLQTPLTQDEEQRLLAAVVVIRTLTGGIDKIVDWVLVSRLFPQYRQVYIQKRWSNVAHRYRLHIDHIQAKFQSKFAEAYGEGTVPTIDFDKTEDYDWAWLVDWTLENIDTSAESLKSLPARRSELDEIYDVRLANDTDMPEFYEFDSSVILQRREAIMSKKAYVYPVECESRTPHKEDTSEVAVAKSWIRANVITPEATYNSDLARAKLSLVNESSVDIALQELLTARCLAQQNKGRLVPGRNYDISEFFLGRLKKKFNVSQFHRAVVFKRKLDDELAQTGSAGFSYAAENGDLLVVLNMLAHQRITVRPKNPPMEKFGLMKGGYITRKMDKSRLNFDIEIRKGTHYAPDNPLHPLLPPPSAHLGNPKAKIPVWYDIHDHFVPVMWELALGATMLLLALRPGATAAELEKSVRPALEMWELNLILEWMVQVKAAKSTGTGLMVDEWWWMCLGDGEVTDPDTPMVQR